MWPGRLDSCYQPCSTEAAAKLQGSSHADPTKHACCCRFCCSGTITIHTLLHTPSKLVAAQCAAVTTPSHAPQTHQAGLSLQVDAAERMIRDLLRPEDESRNEHKRLQLRELAALNGTLKDEEFCFLCGSAGHRWVLETT